MKGPPDDFGSVSPKASYLHYWFHSLDRLNDELGIGLNLTDWRKKEQKPLLGFYPLHKDAAIIQNKQTQSLNETMKPDQTNLPTPIRLLRPPRAGASFLSAFLREQYECISADFPPGDCTRYNQGACSMVHACSGIVPPPPPGEDNDVPMVTLLRDPVQRYISSYHTPGHHGKGTDGNIVLHSELFPEYGNTMVKYFSRQPIGTWKQPGGNQPRTQPPADYKDTATLLPIITEQAQRLLLKDSVRFVGILEYFEDSILLFCRMFVCDSPALTALPRTTSRHTAPYSSSNKTLTALEHHNRFDRILYQTAQRRFCRDLMRYQRLDAEFSQSLSAGVQEMCRSLGAPNEELLTVGTQ